MWSKQALDESKSCAEDIKLCILFHIFKRKGTITHGSYLKIVGLDYPNAMKVQGNNYVLLMKTNMYKLVINFNTHALRVDISSNIFLP